MKNCELKKNSSLQRALHFVYTCAATSRKRIMCSGPYDTFFCHHQENWAFSCPLEGNIKCHSIEFFCFYELHFMYVMLNQKAEAAAIKYVSHYFPP